MSDAVLEELRKIEEAVLDLQDDIALKTGQLATRIWNLKRKMEKTERPNDAA